MEEVNTAAEEEHLGYLRFDENGLCTSPDGLKKLSHLYHRVKEHAPWLLMEPETARGTRLRMKHCWIMLAIYYLWALTVDDLAGLTIFMCQFLKYFAVAPYHVFQAFDGGKVSTVVCSYHVVTKFIAYGTGEIRNSFNFEPGYDTTQLGNAVGVSVESYLVRLWHADHHLSKELEGSLCCIWANHATVARY